MENLLLILVLCGQSVAVGIAIYAIMLKKSLKEPDVLKLKDILDSNGSIKPTPKNGLLVDAILLFLCEKQQDISLRSVNLFLFECGFFISYMDLKAVCKVLALEGVIGSNLTKE